jgi:hypothetical protein
MLSRKIKHTEIRTPISAIPSHLQTIHSPKPRVPAAVTGFSPNSSTASPPIQGHPAIPSPPPKSDFEADIDLTIRSLSQAVLRMGQELRIEFLLACRTPLAVSEKIGRKVQFIIQHTRQPLRLSAKAINTAEIASILNSPPPLPSKQPLVESLITVKSNAPLNTIRLPPPDDDELPSSIDPDIIMFLGDSAEILPPLQLEQLPGQDQAQGRLTFTLRYTTNRTGFTAVGGLRLYLVEVFGIGNTARLLRKWETIADIWVRP